MVAEIVIIQAWLQYFGQLNSCLISVFLPKSKLNRLTQNESVVPEPEEVALLAVEREPLAHQVAVGVEVLWFSSINRMLRDLLPLYSI